MKSLGVFRHFRALRPSAFALTLLLTATHCVDIDDRDLEVTDGDDDIDPLCEPDADDTDCTLCTKDSCCDEVVTCNESDDCLYFADCWSPCNDDVCIDYCVEQYPQGALEFAELLSCTYDSCLDVCS